MASPETIHSFELSTERRARERQEYDRQASEEAALKALLEEEQRRKLEEEEKKEVARLRQEQVKSHHQKTNRILKERSW